MSGNSGAIAGQEDKGGPSDGADHGLALRGVAYDVSTNFETGQGALSRAAWSTDRMLAEIAAISGQLNGNSVTLYGSEHGRLAETANAAAERGLHVRLQPRLIDRPQPEVLEHLAEGARLAESLRQQGAAVDLTVGALHSVFTPGIIPGDAYHERMANVYGEGAHPLLVPTAVVDMPAMAPQLNEFLGRAVTVARGIFRGDVGYSAGPFEELDWAPFDFIGLMYQFLRKAQPAAGHIAGIGAYRQWGKPVYIAEFGTATYAQAEEKAFHYWDIVDRSTAVPTILPGYTRDEGAQAAYYLKMFDTFERAGVRGATVGDFIHPTHPYSDDPRLDLDMASLTITKTIRDDFSDPASAYRFEPKESFRAIAGYYAHSDLQAPRQ
ncbi:MAG TPA: hypothetical protein VGG16_10645 [Streptosporangiaceae bacterium]|jgi:hypothetical protein